MMRLLQYENGEFSLIKFPDHNIPEYAILSHTWGLDSEEVDITDILEKRGRAKSGYEKLRFCAEQAARNGLLYFWVDTCCIDKSSSAELDEAIRSMFRWYSAATRCYVYLSDVPEPKGPTSTVESAFAKSRWFTRGWTLQELVAPKSVEFFSQNGEPLGHKNSRLQEIHEITGIAVEALQGRPIFQFSVADRMSWAARRETTRAEDSAYCLLGIFEVHMPIMYGEGKQNALARLQREILIISDPASLTSTDAPWIVPFERNPRFTGREIQLAQLEDRLFAKDHTARTAITGLGGVGKTQLVLELLFRTKEKHKNWSVIWIPATNLESLHQGYLEAAHQLGIPGWEDEKTDVKKLVQNHLSDKHTNQWLLVFDNADDLDMWTGTTRIPVGHKTDLAASRESSRLINYLPRNKQGCIIFTTRDRRVAVKLAQENIIELSEPDNEAATEILKQHLSCPGLVENQRDTTALLKELTYLPLAIVQAAAYINENGIELADYILLLKEKEEEIIDLLSEDFEDNGRYRNLNNPVATTWLISFEKIRQRDSLAAEYLSFMACIEPKDIPQSLLPPGPSRKKEIDAVGTLSAYFFVSRRPADLTLDLHRLVHLTTRNWLRKEGLLVQWVERAIGRLENVFPDDDHKNRALWRMYLPHVRYVLKSDVINKERVALLLRYGRCLYRDGRWNEAEDSFTQLLEVQEKALGEENLDTLISMGNLASTYQNQGRWKEAEALQVQVMEMRKRVLGEEHPDTLTSIGNLALTYLKQGRWKEAEELGVQAMAIRQRVLGEEHPDTLTSMGNLALTYWNQGRWKEAEELEVQLMDISKRVLGEEHPDTLTSISNLALTYTNQCRWKEAEELDVEAMDIRKRVLGQEHPDTLTSMGNLASTYRNQGRWKEAEELEMQVLDTRKSVLGEEHPDTLIGMGNLASTYRNQGRWKEAEELEVQVMDISKRVLGEEHPDTLTSISNLALTYSNEGRWTEAEELEVQVMDTRKRVLGQEHPDTLTSMGNLASTYRNQGRWKEAEELEMQVLDTRKSVLGEEHIDTLTSISNLALTYWNQGQWKEAEELGVQAMAIRKRVLGEEHLDTLTSMGNLALTYWSQGRRKEAEGLQAQELEICTRVLGENHPHTLISMENLALMRKEVSESGTNNA